MELKQQSDKVIVACCGFFTKITQTSVIQGTYNNRITVQDYYLTQC